MTTLRHQIDKIGATRLTRLLVIVAVLGAAFLVGLPGPLGRLLVPVMLALLGSIGLILRPELGVAALLAAALLARQEVGTGTAVALNIATLVLVLLVAFAILRMVVRRQPLRLPQSRMTRPLLFFIISALISLGIGVATWDTAVPRPPNFTLVQLAQWGLYALSGAAFWLLPSLFEEDKQLQLITNFFLLLGGTAAIILAIPGGGAAINIVTVALVRPTLWIALAGLAGGQLLFNKHIRGSWRLFLAVVALVSIYYSFVISRDSTSTWIGVGTVFAVLAWLRFQRLRWPALIVILFLAGAGLLFETVFEFAGGEDDWLRTGGSRISLITRVVEDTMRNPITGLGPAAYRQYGATRPLVYRHITWVTPRISAHNNFVDIFSATGIVGLLLFGWLVSAATLISKRLRARFRHDDFAAGYVNGVIAMAASGLVLMLFADWIIPFVYNVGFPGFQASLIFWLFLGGLIIFERRPSPAPTTADSAE